MVAAGLMCNCERCRVILVFRNIRLLEVPFDAVYVFMAL